MAKWAHGSNQYKKRLRVQGGEPDVSLTPSGTSPPLDPEWSREVFGITWRPFDVSGVQPSTPARARARFHSQLPELIWNAALLEGNTYTLPEVRTLLEGVTVGGKPISETEQILALRDAHARLDEMIADGSFALNKETSDELHRLLARHEAIEAGHFRGEDAATGGGHVQLSDGTRIEGTPHGPGGAVLKERFERLLAGLEELPDPREVAIIYFAAASRTQFYFDGNKRTARLMASGHLMSSGFDAVSIPAARRLEFNIALDELFLTDDATRLNALLATSTID